MPDLPTGTVTFLFTDIEGSTRLWEQHPEAMRLALARHDALLRRAIKAHGGSVFKTIGDEFCAAFATGPDALGAALAAQRALHAEEWGEVPPLRVRVALHTGAAEQREGDYFGPPLNRVSRLLEAAHGGQMLLSRPTADLVRDTLPASGSLRDLGEHRLKDLARPEHIFQFLHPDLPAEFPPLRSLDALPNNLPLQVTSFIGREREIEEVKQFLAKTRLLTLTGAGGTGKTRLALQVAAELLPEYADGVWLTELAPLAPPTSGGYPALVPQTVAAVLGVKEQPGTPLLQTLVETLKPKTLLLVLDNCEHLLGACAALAEALLRSCPDVQLLATSREGLNIPGEAPYRLRSLAAPDPQHLPPTLERLTGYEAVQLFLDRARTVAPSFAVTTRNAPAVAAVCHRLDGIPLAIELAAARVKALPVEKINERLADMFRLLTGGSRTALPRQQTLRALIDWSYDLLSEAERALLRRLSVFAGGWTLEAAEGVCSGVQAFGRSGVQDPTEIYPEGPKARTPERLNAEDVLDLLTSLVEKSLVLYEERGGEERYRLLETVRQYARDRLLEAGETEAVRPRHHDWFLALAQQAHREFFGREPRTWLERLETEHDNFRGALEWSEKHDPEAALRLAGALWRPLWMVRGYLEEGRERIGAVLRAAEQRPEFRRSRVRASALVGAAALAGKQGDTAEARALQAESLAISRELGDRAEVSGRLTHLGILAHLMDDYEAARSLSEESLAISRELGRKPNPSALLTLGNVASAEGDAAAARSWYEESLAMAREAGNTWLASHALSALGRIASAEGDSASARSLYTESMTFYREVGDKENLAYSLEAFARLAALGREWERAARLWGAAVALREAIGVPLRPNQREEWERDLGAAGAALGEAAFAAAWAEGRAMTLETAIQSALDEPV